MSVLNLLNETDESDNACNKSNCNRCEYAYVYLTGESKNCNDELLKTICKCITTNYCSAEHFDETTEDESENANNYCCNDNVCRIGVKNCELRKLCYCRKSEHKVCTVTKSACKCKRIKNLAKESCYESNNTTYNVSTVLSCATKVTSNVRKNERSEVSETGIEACACANEELEEVEELLTVASYDETADKSNCDEDILCIRMRKVALECFENVHFILPFFLNGSVPLYFDNSISHIYVKIKYFSKKILKIIKFDICIKKFTIRAQKNSVFLTKIRFVIFARLFKMGLEIQCFL